MALSHNVLIRGFNSIYQTAPRLFPLLPASEARDGATNTNMNTTAAAVGVLAAVGGLSGPQLERARADFVAYGVAWARLVDEHHRLEEERIFPEVERIVGEEGLMGREEEEHVAIHDGITNFQNYLINLTSPSTLSATKLLSILDSFSAAFHAHLASEPLTLVALQRFSAAFAAAKTTLVEVSLAEGKKSMASLDFVVKRPAVLPPEHGVRGVRGRVLEGLLAGDWGRG